MSDGLTMSETGAAELSDHDMGLYGARDGLMDAERSILGIGLRFPGHSEV